MTTASQNHHSCQFAEKWAERSYYDESDVLCVKYIAQITALVSIMLCCQDLYGKDDKIGLVRWSVSQLPCTQRYVHEYFCILLGGINGCACLLWSFAASLAVILLIYQYDKFELHLVAYQRMHAVVFSI